MLCTFGFINTHKMKKIEHIGIAVKDITKANEIYSKLFNTSVYKQEEVESEHVITSFLRNGPNKIELLQATDERSAIHKFIEKKGEGIHHIAFAVQNVYEETERLKKEGFEPLLKEPKRGADNKIIMFFHPKTTGGVLIEICQDAE